MAQDLLEVQPKDLLAEQPRDLLAGQQAGWGEVMRSLPAQFAAGVETAKAGLKTLTAREGVQQRIEEGTAPGFTTTPGGAATGLVRPGAVLRQEQLRAQDVQRAQRGEIEMAEAAQLEKMVTPQNMGLGQEIVSSVARSAAPTLAGLAAGIVTRNPYLAMSLAGGGGAALQGGATYSEAIDKGATHLQAARASGIDAVLEGVGEALPLKYALKEGTPAAKRIFGTIAAEAGQESATQVMQDMHAFLTYNPEITVKEAWHNLKVAAGSGALMGGVVGGAAQLAESSRQPKDLLSEKIEPISEGYQPQLPAVPFVPRPTKTPGPDAARIIASIDATLDPSTITDEQIETSRKVVAEYEAKRIATPANPATLEALKGLNEISPQRDLGEVGESGKVAANARNYPNQNDEVTRTERPVLYGPEGTAGMRLDQVALQPGVYTIGTPTRDRSEEYLRAYHETLKEWQDKFLPGTTFLIMNEALPTNTAVGWHQRLDTGVHVITPAVLRNMKDSAAFNTNAQAKTFYNLAHEFGHAITEEKFFEGTAPQIAFQVREQAKAGIVDEALVAQLPEIQGAVVREFNRIKQRVISGQMTAADFRIEWMNPAKIHKYSLEKEHYVPGTAPATQLVDSIIRRAFRNNQQLDAAAMLKLRNEYLGLDEYLAEQTARYAYAKRLDESAPLATQNLIQRALQSVRASLADFFKMLKQEGALAPGVRFQEWLDSLTKNPATAPKVGKPKKKKEWTTEKAPAAKPLKTVKKKREVERLDHNVDSESVATKKAFQDSLDGLVALGEFTADSEFYADMQGLIEAGDFDTFIDMLQPILESHVKFEIDEDVSNHAAISEEDAKRPDILSDAQREWKLRGFASKYFKAWFGDWQNDPASSSKVVNANGEPLIVYHATNVEFEAFDAEFNAAFGFHFGTLRAAHHIAPWLGRGYAPGTNILPVVLNLRNPLDLGEALPGMWHREANTVQEFVNRGVLTEEEAAPIIEAYNTQREPQGLQEQIIQLLESKGYDGLKYENTVEGDTSWVAFRPEQIKSVLGTKTFSRSPKLHFELDFDESKPAGYGASRFYKKFKPFWKDSGPLRRALRFVSNLQFKGLEIQQLAHLNPDLDDVQFMTETNNTFERFKAELQGKGDRIAAQWKYNLGKENAAKVARFLQAEFDSDQLWVGLVNSSKTPERSEWVYRPNELFRQKLLEHNIKDAKLATFILDIKNSLLEHVNEAERVISYLYARRYEARPDVLNAALFPIKREFHTIRTQPFFPQGRFGNHVLIIEKKRESQPGYEVVHREAFESEAERDEAHVAVIKRLKPDERASIQNLTDSEYVLMSLPHDFIDIAASELDLGREQVNHLLNILQPVKKEKALKPYDRARLKIGGASKDAARSYSNFMWHNANLLAKLRYRADFNLAINNMAALKGIAEYAGPGNAAEVNRLTQMHRKMQRIRDTVMNPPAEAHTLRSIVALSYLAYNPKTALMNLFGLLTTRGDLAFRLGEVQGAAVLASATKEAMRSINPFDLNARLKGDYLPETSQRALDRAIREGQLTQSYAYHLAGMANASNLQRMPGRNVAGQVGRHAIDIGMWLFRLTELSTRRITFLAQFKAAQKQGENFEQAYQSAILNTNKLQNDYSVGNRPDFLLGKKSLAFVFMSFTQHMAFHAFGGYEIGLRRADRLAGRTPRKLLQSYTLKIALLIMLLAGYEGLPGMENILDLMDILWKKMYDKPLRQDLREFVQAIGGDPVAFAHGLSHDTNFFGLTGQNRFDVSRSIGLGRMVPGTDVIARSGENYEKTMYGLAIAVLGPAGSMAEWLAKTAFGKEGVKEGMKRAPGGIGNVYNAYLWSEEGVLSPSRSRITRDLQTGELRDLTTVEIYGKALGFNPTIVSENRGILFTQHDAKIYWMARRNGLLRDMWKATDQGDREAISDVRENIAEFNHEVAEKDLAALRITPKEVAQSRKSHLRNKRLEEMGLPVQKRYRGLFKDIRQTFDPLEAPPVP